MTQASAATAKESHRVLRSALTAACREELISRNVVKLVPAPRVQSRELRPWDLEETTTFLEAARKDPLYTAFVLAVALGLRRGEILGLRWSDIDLGRRTLTVRNQIQRVQKELYADSTKNRRTRALPVRSCAWRRYAGSASVRHLSASPQGLTGMRATTYSQPGLGERSNRATSAGRSNASRKMRDCAELGFTTLDTDAPRCCLPLVCRHGS